MQHLDSDTLEEYIASLLLEMVRGQFVSWFLDSYPDVTEGQAL